MNHELARYPDRSLHSRVVHELGSKVAGGLLPPGETLPTEPTLMAQFGVSRTVVREATKILAGKGLIETRTRRGSVVMAKSSWHLLDPDVVTWRYQGSHNRDDLVELIELREIIEPAIASLAAIQAASEDIDRMYQLCDRMAASEGDGALFVQVDQQMHLSIVDSIDNGLLRYLYNMIEGGLTVLKRLAAVSPLHGPQNITDHRDVVDAISERDQGAAYLAMQKVVSASRAEIIEQLDAGGDRSPTTTLAGG